MHFTGSPLDRVDHIRSDSMAYEGLLSDWRGRLLALDGLDPRLAPDGGLTWSSMGELCQDTEVILLGLRDEKPHFAPIVTQDGPVVMRSPAMFRALSILPADDAAIYGTALGLITWHNTHRFCGRCGGESAVIRAGWGRRCSRCKTDHFPRTDPVVIMLAEFEGKVLVGRQSRFPPGNYSALAGFLEPGESIEEAVRRELLEESGIPTTDVRYVASQPWPFGGSQLMIGCIAVAGHDRITLDTNELEDAMWVTRDEAIAAMASDPGARFKPPPPFAIAHSLMKAWIAGG